MFSSLIKANIPRWVIAVLYNWYSKLFVKVKWKGVFSKCFAVESGVRQGSSLSPAIFNVFINIFIIRLRQENRGCTINGMSVTVVMYADDLLILSATVGGLQQLLNCCNTVAAEPLLEFNCNKSTCSVIGPAAKNNIEDL